MGDWRSWVLVFGPAVSVGILLTMAVWLNRLDTQRRLDVTSARLIQQMRIELNKLQSEQIAADEDRDRMRSTMAPLRGLSRAIDAIKEATEARP
jgi:hypothetical protein